MTLTRSAARTLKNTMASTSSTSGEYTLIYWGGAPGRGEFVRLAFECAGKEYTQITDRGAVVSHLSNLKTTGYPPTLAPPILKLPGGQFISQTGNILNYLAPKLGLDGSQDGENEDQHEITRAHVNQLVLTALDLNTEAHDIHHPVGVALYYEDQKPESARRAEEFRKSRIPKFLNYFALALEGAPSGSQGYLIGSKATTADLAVAHVMAGLEHALPRRMGALRKEKKYEGLWALKERVESEDNIAQYLKSNKRMKFGNGIFRHYPELDGEE